MKFLIATALLVAVLLASTTVNATRYYVHQSGHRKLKVISEHRAGLQDFSNPNVVVTGEFNDTLWNIGWNTLNVVSNGDFSDEDQAYAAGFFEGQVTYLQAWEHYQNNYKDDPIPENVLSYFDQHITWLEAQIAANNKTSPYWYHVGLTWIQWQGMRDGLNTEAIINQTFTIHKLMSLTSMGDLFDLRAALDPTYDGARDWRKMSKPEYDAWFARNTHCSSLYKITGNFENIYFGHAAWYNFNTMMRIFKHFTLNFKAQGTTAKTISMSSYPGMLSSFDDFYLTDSGFSIIETSLMVPNRTMYDGNIKPETLLYWMRVMVANRMTTSAEDWTSLVSQHNSGTYNNQWMILDLNKFTPGQDLPEGTMWVAEQFPGVVGTKDVTDVLRYGYWPSYNVPSIRELFVKSGYGEAVEKQGPEMNDYEMCVRAQIFRRDQGTVTDMHSFKHIMQYNDFEHDPISNGNPLYAIASRVDLDPHVPQCFGALDAKASSWKDWKNGMTIHAFSGPTPQQPRFGFNITRAVCGPHAGLREFIDFDWQTFQP